uniref:pre-toxin TG domain-containing protein n=1 Tax=Halobacteriovorax sp. TaxID=2020862 RepID=UPI003563E229
SLNNTINTSHLNRWGEDTSFTQESEESIKRFIENIDKKNLNQAIKELELQEKVQTRIESIAAEWDIKFERVENKSPETPIEQYANDLIDLKRCTLKKEACDSINSLSTHNDFKDEYKQLESLYKTSNYIGSSSVDIEYKESAFDFLSLSADSLIQGDIESSQKIEKVALSIIDIGLGLLPVAGIGKDIYELVTGKNLVTDDKLSEFDRTLALVGILSLGSSHYISAAGKVLIKFKNITKSVFSNGVTIVNSARKLGFSKASQLGEFIKSSTGRTWSKIKATGQAVTEKGYKLFKKDVPINNPFPDSGVYARVVDKKFADKIKKGELPLSRPNAGNEAFVTALDDIKDISNPTAYAKRLSLYTDKAGTQLVDTTEYTVLKFKFKPDIQQSIRTPIELLEKRNFGFIPGGRTIGNAREWLISNDAFQRGLIEFVD